MFTIRSCYLLFIWTFVSQFSISGPGNKLSKQNDSEHTLGQIRQHFCETQTANMNIVSVWFRVWCKLAFILKISLSCLKIQDFPQDLILLKFIGAIQNCSLTNTSWRTTYFSITWITLCVTWRTALVAGQTRWTTVPGAGFKLKCLRLRWLDFLATSLAFLTSFPMERPFLVIPTCALEMTGFGKNLSSVNKTGGDHLSRYRCEHWCHTPILTLSDWTLHQMPVKQGFEVFTGLGASSRAERWCKKQSPRQIFCHRLNEKARCDP